VKHNKQGVILNTNRTIGVIELKEKLKLILIGLGVLFLLLFASNTTILIK
jgi:hypothetical protein